MVVWPVRVCFWFDERVTCYKYTYIPCAVQSKWITRGERVTIELVSEEFRLPVTAALTAPVVTAPVAAPVLLAVAGPTLLPVTVSTSPRVVVHLARPVALVPPVVMPTPAIVVVAFSVPVAALGATSCTAPVSTRSPVVVVVISAPARGPLIVTIVPLIDVLIFIDNIPVAITRTLRASRFGGGLRLAAGLVLFVFLFFGLNCLHFLHFLIFLLFLGESRFIDVIVATVTTSIVVDLVIVTAGPLPGVLQPSCSADLSAERESFHDVSRALLHLFLSNSLFQEQQK